MDRRGEEIRLRLPVVGVMGSGSIGHEDKAEPLGRWLAGMGFHLLTGGGGGVMAAVSRAFWEVEGRKGVVIGVIPGPPGGGAGPSRGGYPNPWVEVAIFTHLPFTGAKGAHPLSRNHINVLSSDVVVVLPGGEGTSSEAALALGYGRPVMAFLDDRSDVPGLPEAVPHTEDLKRVKEFILKETGRG